MTDASGWRDEGVGNILDTHAYPGPAAAIPDAKRAMVLGEFGGLGLKVDGHVWTGKTWGYQNVSDSAELTSGYEALWQDTWQLHKADGLSAAVYTQLTDVETETNGLLTYDRALVKLDAERAAAAAHGEFPEQRPILATSERAAQTWRYTLEKPADNWTAATFDDKAWQTGPGGFGREDTPGAVVRTRWTTGDIWLRREFDAKASPLGALGLRLHHDEDAEIYINGKLVAEPRGYSSRYATLRLDATARAALIRAKTCWPFTVAKPTADNTSTPASSN